MKILIVGDSFSADWTIKHKGRGWPNLLASKYNVTNLSQAGVSEYKIYKQIKSVDTDSYDKIIISHTYPFRIYTKVNPFTRKDPLRCNSDIVLNDLYSKHNFSAFIIKKFLKYHFDETYYLDMYQCWFEKLKSFNNCVHIKHLNIPIDVDIDFHKYWLSNRGFINHYNSLGNQHIFEILDEHLKG